MIAKFLTMLEKNKPMKYRCKPQRQMIGKTIKLKDFCPHMQFIALIVVLLLCGEMIQIHHIR